MNMPRISGTPKSIKQRHRCLVGDCCRVSPYRYRSGTIGGSCRCRDDRSASCKCSPPPPSRPTGLRIGGNRPSGAQLRGRRPWEQLGLGIVPSGRPAVGQVTRDQATMPPRHRRPLPRPSRPAGLRDWRAECGEGTRGHVGGEGESPRRSELAHSLAGPPGRLLAN